jgi:hypothetical protein
MEYLGCSWDESKEAVARDSRARKLKRDMTSFVQSSFVDGTSAWDAEERQQ